MIPRMFILSLLVFVASTLAAENHSVTVSGELKQWHKVTLTLDGPHAKETDNSPNPFTDLAMTVTFTHESGTPTYAVPGYFSADGDAAETSAVSGTKWRAHLSPDKVGTWNYRIAFRRGANVALNGGGDAVQHFDGLKGSFKVAATNKTGRDFRARGRLQYVGERYLKFAGDQSYFLKAGPDAPETLLGFADIDNTVAGKPRKVPLKTWKPHLPDWNPSDPTWQINKGKGLIGAMNYLANKGLNSVSFLTYNAGGDGDNVWPFVERNDKLHYDCSKLDQWGIVFDHATNLGLHLHFKLQENELDDNRIGHQSKSGRVRESLDGGLLGLERKLYCREIVARFGHELALNWNIGEENTQSPEEIRAMAEYLKRVDPYDHNIVIHTFPDQQDKVYSKLLGDQSVLTGASLQNSWQQVHQRTLKWIEESGKAGRPWIVANDEQGPASEGVPADPGYQGKDGNGKDHGKIYTLHDVRKRTLWGNLMAGGAGVEYYFGYRLPQNDLICEDYRSRDQSWDFCRIAIEFFADKQIPFWEMNNADELVGNNEHDNSKYCLSKPNYLYLVYLPNGGTTSLDLSGGKGKFLVQWFNPRQGGDLENGTVNEVSGNGIVALGNAPEDADQDWLIVVKAKAFPYTVTDDAQSRELSAAMNRTLNVHRTAHINDNELYSQFKYTKLEGLDYNNGDGTISRRDPTKVLFENGKYYVWYTKRHTPTTPMGPKECTDTIPSTDWDLSDLWYATSQDGFHWKEQGVAVPRPPKPELGWRSVTTPGILKWKGRFYLYYQAFMEASGKRGDYCPVAASWSDSPDGPWTPANKIVIENGSEGEWDQYAIHDPCPLVHNGQIYLYYKSAFNRPGNVWINHGLATSDNPFGPFQKHPLNPLVNSGHETTVFPFKQGAACIALRDGQEHFTIQYAEDWVNFEVAAITELLPTAAGPFVPDAFTDTKDGRGITWGISHFTNAAGDWKLNHAVLTRFDCDLSQDVDDPEMKRHQIDFTLEEHYRRGLTQKQRQRQMKATAKLSQQR